MDQPDFGAFNSYRGELLLQKGRSETFLSTSTEICK